MDDTMLDEAAGVEFVKGAQPEVTLMDFPYEADVVLATVVRGYGQVYDTEISAEEIVQYLSELEKTKLKTPLRFLNTVWLIKNVTRAWCNQLTRYSLGTGFVQESLRFSVHGCVQVLIPSSLTPAAEAEYRVGVRAAVGAYKRAMMLGGAVQDARGLLPLNTLTSIFVTVNMQSLCHIYEQRQCCQAQTEEWTPVLNTMKTLVTEESETVGSFMEGSWENPNCVTCGFKANFDRPCHRQELFDKNLVRLAIQKQLDAR